MQRETIKKFSKSPAGRKYGLAIMIFIAATILCAVPPCISIFVYKIQMPLILLSGSEWVTVMSMIGAFYFSANVAQKKFIDRKHIDQGNKHIDQDNNSKDIPIEAPKEDQK